MAYYVDLQLFLGGEIATIPQHYDGMMMIGDMIIFLSFIFLFPGDEWHRKLGSVPQKVLDEFSDTLNEWRRDKVDLIHTREQADNGYKKYLKSRPGASKESVKRARDYKDMKIGCHPALKTAAIDFEEEKSDILDQLKSFKPKSTIFEIGNTSKNKEKIDVMSEKRKKHCDVIERNAVKLEKTQHKFSEETEAKENVSVGLSEGVTEEDIENTFDEIVKEGKNRSDFKSKAKARERKALQAPSKDEDNYIPYQPSDHHSEAG